FFFQAEDGIRDGHVTGVQTCALPIYLRVLFTNVLSLSRARGRRNGVVVKTPAFRHQRVVPAESYFTKKKFTSLSRQSSKDAEPRSEERRVGKECRLWGWRSK